MGDMGIQTTMAIMEDLKKTVKEQHIKEPAECKELLIDEHPETDGSGRKRLRV